MTRKLGFTNDEAAQAANSEFVDNVKIALGSAINSLRGFAEDENVDEPVVIAGLAAVQRLVGRRAHLAQLAVGTPIAALGGGTPAPDTGDDQSDVITNLQTRIADLEEELEAEQTAKASVEQLLRDARAELDPHTVDSVVYKLNAAIAELDQANGKLDPNKVDSVAHQLKVANEKLQEATDKLDAKSTELDQANAQNQSLLKDRQKLEQVFAGLGLTAPATNDPFPADTVQQIRDMVQTKVDEAAANAAAPFDEAALRSEFDEVEAALQAVSTKRHSANVEGLDAVAESLKKVTRRLGLAAQSGS